MAIKPLGFFADRSFCNRPFEVLHSHGVAENGRGVAPVGKIYAAHPFFAPYCFQVVVGVAEKGRGAFAFPGSKNNSGENTLGSMPVPAVHYPFWREKSAVL